MRLASVAVVALLGICSPSSGKPVRAAASADAALLSKAKRVVADSLKDPGSAQFRGLHFVTDALGTRKVCGQVNGKNGYGGYVGFRDFAYLIRSGGIEVADEDGVMGIVGEGC